MKILIISALFPPHVMGGAELSAWNLACRLRDRGYSVAVMCAADSLETEERGVNWDGLEMWRVYVPRCYPVSQFPKAAGWMKPIWHFQDHFDPRNRSVMAMVLDAVKPDLVNIHYLQGFGYNTLPELAKRNLPTLYTLHDLGLACVRMSMFKDGEDCARQCKVCELSSRFKQRQLRGFDHIAFCSPSDANLQKLSAWFPVKHYRTRVLLNPNHYPAPRIERAEANCVRLLYVGRISTKKGVAMLLKIVAPLANEFRFEMTVMGGGPEEQELRSMYGQAPWCRFTGHVSEQEVSDQMAKSDVLCVPSLWAENSPGVVVHALSQGLPVIGSNKGGIPELVRDGITGRLVEAGDEQAWNSAIRSVLAKPSHLNEWRTKALSRAHEFNPEYLVEKYEEFLSVLAEEKPLTCA